MGVRNKAYVLEGLHRVRLRLYLGVTTSAHSGGDAHAGYFACDANDQYVDPKRPHAVRWSLCGATIAEKFDEADQLFEKLSSKFGGVWTTNCQIVDATPERIFGLLDAVQEEVEKW